MRILDRQEVLYAINSGLIKITPHFVPEFLVNNTYETHPYSIQTHPDAIQPITNRDTLLKSGNTYMVTTAENALVSNNKIKIGIMCPYFLSNAAFGQIGLNTEDGIKLRFTPKYNLTINSKTPIANIFFLYDDTKLQKVKTKSNKEIFFLPAVQTIEPMYVEQTIRKKQYFERIH